MLKHIQHQKQIKPRTLDTAKIGKPKIEAFVSATHGSIDSLRRNVVSAQIAIAA